jgi:hypothetical protein
MKSPAQEYGIDIDYLRRCKESTPAQRLDWLAAALEFTISIERARKTKSN